MRSWSCFISVTSMRSIFHQNVFNMLSHFNICSCNWNIWLSEIFILDVNFFLRGDFFWKKIMLENFRIDWSFLRVVLPTGCCEILDIKINLFYFLMMFPKIIKQFVLYLCIERIYWRCFLSEWEVTGNHCEKYRSACKNIYFFWIINLSK